MSPPAGMKPAGDILGCDGTDNLARLTVIENLNALRVRYIRLVNDKTSGAFGLLLQRVR